MYLEQIWFERKFTFDLELQQFPLIVERLRGTPARLEERVRDIPRKVLTKRRSDVWSIQENVGHLVDLEPLWIGRLDDLMKGVEYLRPADLQNIATHEANHNDKVFDEILQQFRSLREECVVRLDSASQEDVLRSALHPRLEKPMRMLDLAYFVAEHDDHHLATITNLLVQ